MTTTVLVMAPYFVPAVDGGGPIRTLDALTLAAPSRFEVEVLTRDRDLGGSERLSVPVTARAGRRIVHYIDTRGFVGVVRLARALSARRPDLAYLNSVFDARFSILPLTLRRAGLSRAGTVVIAPRGEFDPGALAIRPGKKLRYLRAARTLGFFRGTIWHASTDAEALHIRSVVGAQARIVVRENETRLPDKASRSLPPDVDELRLVALGRIAPKKRVHLVLEALVSLAPASRISLTVIGPVDDAAYSRRCRALVSQLNENVTVDWMGSVPHERVIELLSDAHAMVSATAGENFGHTVAESLAAGRPVLLSDTTPWSDRVSAGGGTVVHDDTVAAWRRALATWAGMPVAERSERARRAAETYDSWRSAEAAPHVFDLIAGLQESRC